MHTRTDELLAQHEQRGRANAAAHEQCALRTDGRLPAATDRPDELGGFDFVGHIRCERGKMVRAETHRLIQHIERAAGRIGRIHREGTAQHVALHSGDLHMHELTGFDRGRDGRRGKRHEIQIRADALVLQNADPLVHKRHRAPSVTVAAMRPLLRWERLYHCSS